MTNTRSEPYNFTWTLTVACKLFLNHLQNCMPLALVQLYGSADANFKKIKYTNKHWVLPIIIRMFVIIVSLRIALK